MKIEDLAHSIVLFVFERLEKEHHYVVPEEIRKEVVEETRANLDKLISGGGS